EGLTLDSGHVAASPATLLHHMRRLMCHKFEIAGVLACAKPDMVLMSKRLGVQALGCFVGGWPCVNLDMAEISTQHWLDAGSDLASKGCSTVLRTKHGFARARRGWLACRWGFRMDLRRIQRRSSSAISVLFIRV